MTRMSADQDEVMFDILLRSAGSGRLPHAGNVQDFRAPAEEIECCRRWFAAAGLLLHATPFGLSGSTSRETFQTVFRVKLEPTDGAPGQPRFKAVTEPLPPPELAEAIDQITLSAPPEFF